MKRFAFALAALALTLANVPLTATTQAAVQARNSYTNATWGYSITWDDNVWFALAQDDAAQETDLLLSNGISYVKLVADDTIPAPQLCVTGFEAGLPAQEMISDVEPVLDVNGSPIRSVEDDRAFVALSFTLATQGQTIKVIEYLECRTLVRGQAVLRIDHFVIPSTSYKAEVPLVETLLGNITIPDNAGPNNQTDQTPTPAPTEPTTATAEATAETRATAEPDTASQAGELGPVFASGAWRVSIVAGVRSPGVNAIGLKRRDGKDWIVLVADVTNWTNSTAGITLRNIQLAFPEGETPVRPAPNSSATAARALRIALTDVAEEQSFRANQTRRVVLAYSVNEDLTDPTVSFGTTIPIAEVFAREVDFENLPSVARPPKLVQAEVDRILDGNSLEVFLPDDEVNQTVSLHSIVAPTGRDCFADEAAERLSQLAGATVFLEPAGDDGSAADARYIWSEAEDGTRTLINREMLAGGFAIFQESASTRFTTWLQGAEQQARDQEAGLWKDCADQLPVATEAATVTPTPAPTEPSATETAEPTTAPTSTPSSATSPSSTATPATPQGSPSSSPAATAATSATPDVPASTMFRAGPAHTGIQPGPGLEAPAKLPWEFQATSAIFSSAAIVDGVIYVGSLDGSLYALDSRSGPPRWQFTTGAGILSSPSVANGVVYVGSEDMNLYAVDAETGRERWRFATAAAVSSSPAIVDGIVYVGGMDTYVYAVDANTGDEVWKVRVGQAFSSPAVVDGVLYIGGGQSLFALDAKTGEEKWRVQTGGPVESSPAVSGDLVVIGNDAGSVLAVNRETGSELWRFQAADAVISSPAVADGMVFVGSNDNNVYGLDAATGEERWRYETGDSVTSSPAVAEGVVFIGSFDGYVYGLDSATGGERWRYQAGPILSSPSVVGNVVYFGSADGRLLARQPFNPMNIGG
ncbi:MAG: eukaryotic-like serine/threonine-protein kinase [Thermomicrobiales bacterium]|nr:eukaryotic-like serine/threonine-protein kinase [Thermomicrobiales bacterium]